MQYEIMNWAKNSHTNWWEKCLVSYWLSYRSAYDVSGYKTAKSAGVRGVKF